MMAINMMFLRVFTTFLSLFFSNYICSQNFEQEYLTNSKINKSGTVLSYYVSGKKGNTLYLNDLKNHKVYNYGNINQNHILNDDFFIGIDQANRTLITVDFINQVIDSLIGVDDFDWIQNTNTVVVYNRETKILRIINLKTGFTDTFNDICDYITSLVSSNVAFVNNEQTVFYYSTFNNVSTKFDKFESKSKIKKLHWDKGGTNIFGFFVENENFKIHKYSKESNQFVFSSSIDLKDKKMQVDTMFNTVLVMKDERIAVSLKNTGFFEVNSGEPEIWLGSSNGITPHENKLKSSNMQLAVINIKEKKIYDYSESERLLKFVISGQEDDIYSYEKSSNYNFSRINPEIEIFEYDRKHFKKKYVGTFNAADQNIKSTVKSDLLFYFKDNNWNFYDKKTKRFLNFTKNIEDNFFYMNNEFYEMIDYPINQYLLSYKEKYLLFNGAKQLWLFDLVSKKMKQVKNNSNKSYSISQANYSINRTQWDWNISVKQLDYDNVVLTWKSENHTNEGISLLNDKEEIVDILDVNSKIKQIARGSKKISYIRESADQPPALYIFDFDSQKETLIFQSNLADTLAKSIKVVYHNWLNDQNKKRGAVVTYPINYDTTIKYPAIFDIYEQKKSTQHDYVTTILTNGNGINSRVYSNEGFFVIRPDIYYEIGSPGRSATDCVIDVLDKLIKILPIDTNNIGLIGHSFGGYETNYIITQTNRFKAAVSSSGVADIISAYFTFSLEYKIPDIFRYETQQFRIGKSFFDSKNKYIDNSPLFHSEKINTPLLLLTGKNDYVVNWTQSITMFLALKRLNKIVNLILYPNEGHVLMNKNNKEDASDKIKSWFEYYLKNRPKPDWLE
ncbi:alpha/beta hydrolase family protein [Sphingobacterium faecale]|uniref:S9 family peptidase n=1 Tax=Sphingobacterium faecale TaxID=2803775 RepID=A0ABS1R8A1_9SPHI|nr:prolyl oligopeptidase family serine peptidase [Sphingobacterium faecale]MBL1410212.1 S9 family peptidase [Sphingobacterium faecale]